MSTLLEKQVRVSRTVTTSQDHARAIEDPIRARTVELLYRRSLSAEQIAAALKKSGHKKALTTVRHHLDILKNAGLIEISKIDESKGAIIKYYSTSTRLLGFRPPDDFDSKYSRQIASTSAKIEKILQDLAPKHKRSKKSAEYGQYLVMEIMNRAMTRVMEGPGRP